MKLICTSLLPCCSLPSALADEKGRSERHEKEKFAEKFPFFPSLLSTADGRAVASSDFEDPAVCMGCHPEIYKQWNGSMHSNAFVDPVFQALWRIGVKETNGAVEKLCAGCHTAIGTVAGEVKLGPDGVFQASDIAKKGVQCDLCHTIKGRARARDADARAAERLDHRRPGQRQARPVQGLGLPLPRHRVLRVPHQERVLRATATTSSTPRTTSRSRTPTASGRTRSTPRPASSARTAT